LKKYTRMTKEQSNTRSDGEKQMAFATNKLTGWKIGGTMYITELKEASQPVLNAALITLGASIIIGVLLMILIIRSITGPLRELVSSAKSISGGDSDAKNHCPLKR
jgi:methyl-accepting chemotaxis protein